MKKCFVFMFCFVIGQQILYAQTPEKMSQCSLRVGVYDNSPKIFMSEQGVPQGIFIDVIQEIALLQNWHLTYVYGNWHELEQKLQQGLIDMLPDVAFTQSRDSLYLFNTIPILESWLEVFVLKPYKISSLYDLHTKKIAVLQGAIQEQFIQPFLKKIGVDVEIVPFPTYESSVCALQDGTVDVLLASRFFYFSDLYNPSILSTSHVFNPTQLHVAFRQDFDTLRIADFDAELLKLLNNGKSPYYESLHTWLHRDYSPSIPLYIWVLLLVLGVGVVLFMLFVVILRKRVAQKTESLQQLNYELVSAKQKAEESNTLKSMFLQNMSHEIRTPMNGILGFVDLLRESDISFEEKEKYIGIIEKSAQRLLALIDEILEMSKIKSGQMQVFQSRIPLQNIMQFVYDFYYPQIHAKNIAFEIQQTALSDTTEITTDVLKLETILLCLLSNALKFTRQGSIECGCYYTETTIVFFVKDTGIGIDAEQSESIFEMFVQGQNSIDSEYGGAGLGLAIAKAYAILLGGTVWFESELGKGSTFYVSLPYSQNK